MEAKVGVRERETRLGDKEERGVVVVGRWG